LRDKCEDVKETLPEFVHRERSMRAVAVVQKRLREQREIPVQDEEDKDIHTVVLTRQNWATGW